jgi:hypothetical protein
MVPGMTERERLAADVQRMEWLADARLGPARVSWPLARGGATASPRPTLPLGLWRRGIASALVFGRHIRLARPGLSNSLRTSADAASR